MVNPSFKEKHENQMQNKKKRYYQCQNKYNQLIRNQHKIQSKYKCSKTPLSSPEQYFISTWDIYQHIIC